MKTLIIYDSAFGNTEKIAKAIGDAIGPKEDVSVLRITSVGLDQLKSLDLLIVGSPTQGFRPTKAISGFLETIPKDGLKNVRIAAFDTRIDVADIKQGALRAMVKMGGYAAKHIEDALKKKGAVPVMPPEGFFVKDREGPLRDGELERAATWAKQIAEMAKAK